MPELPEVETVMRGLAVVMEGGRIARTEQRRPDLRFPLPENFAKRLTSRRVRHLTRRAKYILAHLDEDEVLAMHLGMTGRFTIQGAPIASFHHDPGTDPKHDHVVFGMSGGHTVTYNDPRRFGFMELWPAETFDTVVNHLEAYRSSQPRSR